MTAKPVIVTGSSGFIGEALVHRLHPEYKVLGFDREGAPFPPEEADWIFIDLTSDESVQNAFHIIETRYGNEIASVVHLAAYYDFSGEPSKMYDEVNVRGTERLLREFRNFKVDQFVYSSTMLVHGPCQPGQKITEESPVDARWEYPKSKVKAEEVIMREHGDIPVVILRISGVYDDYCNSIPLAQQIKRIYERQVLSHVYPGTVDHGQSFMHVDDLVSALYACVQLRDRLPRELTLLLGEPEVATYRQMQEELGRLIHGEHWDTIVVPKPLAKAGAWVQGAIPTGEEPFIKPWMIDMADDHYDIDVSKAMRYLNWSCRHTLLGTLPNMVAALKSDPLRWYRDHKLEPPGWLSQRSA